MIDQIRAVGNIRLIRKIAVLPSFLVESVKENIAILLDLEQTGIETNPQNFS